MDQSGATRITRLLLLLLTSSSLTPAFCADDYPPVWKLAHPDAKALAGVNIRALGDSPAVRKYKKEFETSSGLSTSPASLFPMKNLAVLKEIDHIFISSPGSKTADAKGDAKQNPPVLVVVNGHFSPESLAQIFKGTPRVYHSVEIYGSPQEAAQGSAQDATMNIAKLNATTLLMGDDASLRGAIDRSTQATGGASTKAQTALLARAANMAATHDLWVIGTASPSALQPANFSLGKILSDIHGFDMGFSLRNGLTQELSVTVTTPALAHEMAQQFSAQLQLAAAANLGSQDGLEVLKKVAVTSEGARIGLNINLNQDELDRLIRTAQANRQKATLRPPTIIEPPKTIKIYGLDEGVREIPVASR